MRAEAFHFILERLKVLKTGMRAHWYKCVSHHESVRMQWCGKYVLLLNESDWVLPHPHLCRLHVMESLIFSKLFFGCGGWPPVPDVELRKLKNCYMGIV